MVILARFLREIERFWLNAANNSPHYIVAHSNLGSAYYSMGSLEEAEKEYTECPKVGPLHPSPGLFIGFLGERLFKSLKKIKDYLQFG
jgi:hypothetical protein